MDKVIFYISLIITLISAMFAAERIRENKNISEVHMDPPNGICEVPVPRTEFSNEVKITLYEYKQQQHKMEQEEVRIAEQPAQEKYTKDEYLIAKLMLAEAGGESELGQKLVVDTVLNRLDSGQYGNTIEEIIYAKNQYESVSIGAFDRMEVSEEHIRLVQNEMKSRENHEVLHFRTEKYHDFGVPMFQVGAHFFSK